MEWNSLTMDTAMGSWNTPHRPMRRNITVAPNSSALRTPILRMMIGTTPIMADSRNTWNELSVPYVALPISVVGNREA